MLSDQYHYNRIPLVRELPCDHHTPLSIYAHMANAPYSFLFESAQPDQQFGRFSFIGLPCKEVVRISGSQIDIEYEGDVIDSVQTTQVMEWLSTYIGRYRAQLLPNLPPFTGGMVGYFGAEMVRYCEPHLAGIVKPDQYGAPDVLLMLADELIVFDNQENKLFLIVHYNPHSHRGLENAELRIDLLSQKIQESKQKNDINTQIININHLDSIEVLNQKEQKFISSYPKEKFTQGVNRIKDYILAGDVMQVVLSQRLSADYARDGLHLYAALREINPSPHMFLLNFGDFEIAGSSPEILTKVENRKITVRPLAGTRPRGATPELDERYVQDLLADPKEIAEHLMLIDLGRNDVGRVSEVGQVKVTEQMIIEKYSHVMHLTSNVVGTLQPNLTALDALMATFPAGTLSGAPKIRALEIIDELEPVKRGIYGGAVGYIGWHGNMDTAIAIRSAVIKDGKIHIQAGCGVVADSDPELEWQETMNKARAVLRAVALAEAAG